MKTFIVALQLLTIIPLNKNITIDKSEISRCSIAFVPVGIFQGIILILVYLVTNRLFSNEIVAGIILMTSVLYNAGFHIDGLSDTFDGIAVNGNKEKKLSIMKEGTAGPIGVIAIFFVLLLKFLSIKNLMLYPLSAFYTSILLMPVFSKLSIIISMFHAKPAKQEGMGNLFVGKLKFKEVLVSFLIFIGLFLSLKLILNHSLQVMDFIFCCLLISLIYIFCRLSNILFNRQFGGLTGDTLGAISEISELLFLFFILIWYKIFSY